MNSHLYLFGSWRLERGGESLHLPTRKAESLLAYLELHPGAHAREKLAALLWGDVGDEQARGSLRKALTHLRAVLGDEALFADRQSIQLDPAYPLWCDVREFERVSKTRVWASLDTVNETCTQLTALYRGDLLADFYDEWVFAPRQECREQLLDSLLALTQEFRAHSEYSRAMETALRVLELDRANERAHQHLIFCYIASGNRHAALKQYEECERALREELDVEPARETQAMYAWLKQIPSAGASIQARLTNLPIPLSTFVGRHDETETVKHFLKSEVRLVTLTGPGGSGKTRLAIRTATDLICENDSANLLFEDGVWWTELAAIADPFNVIPQIAQTLGVREGADESLSDTVKAFLQSKQLLLILDNCEHVLSASAQVAHELLVHCPRLKVLATSREQLRIAGEQVYLVPPMRVPRREAWTYADLLREFEGVRLFVERARLVQPTFQLGEENARAVAQICARLDGLPLALELAASRVNLLSPQEIAARLDARFDLLKDTNRTAPPRHQTLRAVLDWSCDLLSNDERVLFRRLSVFAGGCTFDALNAVAGESETKNALFDTLARLVDKSLVTATTNGDTTRYGMLETIGEYAREMLDASGEADRIRTRHLDYFAQFAETAETNLRGASQGTWLAQLDTEMDNVRAALEWASANDVEKALQVAGALEWYWNLRGHWSEGAQRLTRLLTISREPTRGRARALLAASNLKFWGEQDFETARRWLETSVALYRETSPHDRWHLGYALALYGAALVQTGDNARAERALQESLTYANELSDAGSWICGWAHLFAAWAASEEGAAREHYETSIGSFRTLQDRAQLQVALAQLAWFYIRNKEFDAARAAALEGLAGVQMIGDALGEAWYQKLFGDLEMAQDHLQRAAAHYQNSFEQFQRLSNRAGMKAASASMELVQNKIPL